MTKVSKTRTPVYSLFGVIILASQTPLNAADIDFSGIPAGTIVDEISEGSGASGGLSGTVGVNGFNPGLATTTQCASAPPCNAAVAFDSANPVGDLDLGTPNECVGGPGVDHRLGNGTGGECGSPFENVEFLGNLLIVNEQREFVDRDGSQTIDSSDSPVNLADDADLRGQFLEFDFSTTAKNGKGTVTVNSLTYMDNDEGEFGAQVELSGPGFSTKVVGLPAVGDNGVLTLPLGVEGVSHMKVLLNGSGAVVASTVDEEIVRPCWVTTGGFDRGTQADAAGKKICTFGGNVGPPPSGAFEVNWHDGPLEGTRFHTNDIQALGCIDMGSTGPQQPGGKKGLEVDTLLFECTGLLNNQAGFTCEGYLKDAGEPSGKKANERDEISMTVKDGSGAVVAVCEGDLDGGNVQIHPPVGKP